MPLFSRKGKTAETAPFSFPPVIKLDSKGNDLYRLWIQNHRWTLRNEEWSKKQLERFAYRPDVGILMECKDPKEDFLRESLSSIFHQIYPFNELSIVDRGSRDPKIRTLLEEVRQDPRVKVSFQKGTERDVEAIAKIMKKADSEWLLLMGAEDILEPNTLYNMIATLQNSVEIDFVFSDSDLIDDQGVRYDPQFKPVWAVGSFYPLGHYQHPVLLSRRLVEKLRGSERVSALMQEGSLLDEASNHSRYVLQAPGILYHARGRGLKNETPPPPVDNVLINENFIVQDGSIIIDRMHRVRSEPNVPLKVLWLIESLERDDAPITLYHFVRYLTEESKHQFTVVSLNDGPLKPAYEKICKVHVMAEGTLSDSLPKLHEVAPFDVAFTAAISNDWFPEILKQMQLPTLRYVHLEKTQPHTFEYPASIVFLNNQISKQFEQYDSRHVIRNLPVGVEHTHVRTYKQKNSPFDLRTKRGIALQSKVFTIAGPTIQRKGQLVFVNASLDVLKRNPESDLNFFIAGARPGSYLDEINAVIEASGKQKHFHLFPETEDIFQYYPYYLMSDMVVSCSSSEVFPLTILEAMAMKKAVIGTDVFSLNTVIENDENGYLIAVNDPKELADRMDFLVRKPDLFEFFGRRSLEIVYEKFQLKKIATRLEELLRETIVYEQ